MGHRRRPPHLHLSPAGRREVVQRRSRPSRGLRLLLPAHALARPGRRVRLHALPVGQRQGLQRRHAGRLRPSRRPGDRRTDACPAPDQPRALLPLVAEPLLLVARAPAHHPRTRQDRRPPVRLDPSRELRRQRRLRPEELAGQPEDRRRAQPALLGCRRRQAQRHRVPRHRQRRDRGACLPHRPGARHPDGSSAPCARLPGEAPGSDPHRPLSGHLLLPFQLHPQAARRRARAPGPGHDHRPRADLPHHPQGRAEARALPHPSGHRRLHLRGEARRESRGGQKAPGRGRLSRGQGLPRTPPPLQLQRSQQTHRRACPADVEDHPRNPDRTREPGVEGLSGLHAPDGLRPGPRLLDQRLRRPELLSRPAGHRRRQQPHRLGKPRVRRPHRPGGPSDRPGRPPRLLPAGGGPARQGNARRPRLLLHACHAHSSPCARLAPRRSSTTTHTSTSPSPCPRRRCPRRRRRPCSAVRPSGSMCRRPSSSPS